MTHKKAVPKHPPAPPLVAGLSSFSALFSSRDEERWSRFMKANHGGVRPGANLRNMGSLVSRYFRPASTTQGYRSACKPLILFVMLLTGITLAGCAAQSPPAPQSPPLTVPAPSDKEIVPPELPQAGPPPHVVASLQLTDQGRLLLEEGRTDDAIRILERAVNLNPTNGQNYYYLAEAWIRKKNLPQAKEFNRLASLYFQEDKTWLSRVKVQRDRIEKGIQ